MLLRSAARLRMLVDSNANLAVGSAVACTMPDGLTGPTARVADTADGRPILPM